MTAAVMMIVTVLPMRITVMTKKMPAVLFRAVHVCGTSWCELTVTVFQRSEFIQKKKRLSFRANLTVNSLGNFCSPFSKIEGV